MVEFRWIKMCLYLILVFQFTATTVQHRRSLFVRDGDEVTLHCGNGINDRDKCDRTTWLFSRFPATAAQGLFELGRTVESAKAKSDRLSVTANCSLVIKALGEDVGRYFCQQPNKSGQLQSSNSLDLSVITMTEHKDTDRVTLTCSASTYQRCGHKVRWLFSGTDVDKDNEDLKTSQSYCSSNVTFTASHFVYASEYRKLLKCEVTDEYTGNVFPFSPRSSGTATGANKTTPGNNYATTKPQDWWWLYVVVAVGLAAACITVAALVRWKRNKGNITRRDEHMGLSLNPEVNQSAPETSQHTWRSHVKADPGVGVSYASISYTKKTHSKARVRGGDDAVTYSTVKAPSSSAGASDDPSNLYATVN